MVIEQVHPTLVMTPPYIGYGFFLAFIDNLRDEGVPDEINVALARIEMHSAHRSQMRGALRFLGLIDTGDRPTQALRDLARADERQRRTLLGQLIETAYAPRLGAGFRLAELDSAAVRRALASAAENESTRRKFVNFLENAWKHVVRGAAVETTAKSLTGSRAGANGNDPAPADALPSNDAPKPDSAAQEAKPALPGGLPEFDHSWPDEVKIKWFDLYGKLLDAGSKRG